jgi:hypothetical protein
MMATPDRRHQPSSAARAAVSASEQPSAKCTSNTRNSVGASRMIRVRRKAPHVLACASQPTGNKR